MRFRIALLTFLVCLGAPAFAQQSPSNPPAQGQSSSQRNLDRDAEANESSSRDPRTDITPPADDAKNHPRSPAVVSEAEGKIAAQPEAAPSDVQEVHPFNPYKAGKDVEVGD